MLPEGKEKKSTYDKITNFFDSLEPQIGSDNKNKPIDDESTNKEQTENIDNSKENQSTDNEWKDSVRLSSTQLRTMMEFEQEDKIIPRKKYEELEEEYRDQ